VCGTLQCLVILATVQQGFAALDQLDDLVSLLGDVSVRPEGVVVSTLATAGDTTC